MAHTFKINSASLKREFAVYVVIACQPKKRKIQLYVGKTGDNREGCNPMISRCGNHFSYNKVHSQVRNKILNHEKCEYSYVFDHFSPYSENIKQRKIQIDQINEMERWLRQEIELVAGKFKNCQMENPFKGSAFVKKEERGRRAAFRTRNNETKIREIVEDVSAILAEI